MLENYLQANKVACDHVKNAQFWCMVLFSRNNFHSKNVEVSTVICCRLLLIPCTLLEVDHLNLTQLSPSADCNNIIFWGICAHSCLLLCVYVCVCSGRYNAILFKEVPSTFLPAHTDTQMCIITG